MTDNRAINIKEHCGVTLLNGSYANSLYGIPNAYIQGEQFGYVIRKDLASKYGIEIDPEKYYTLDDLTDIFTVVKAGEGDGFYCFVPSNTSADLAAGFYIEVDRIGGDYAAGVLMLNRSFEDLSIQNIFATDEYAIVHRLYAGSALF